METIAVLRCYSYSYSYCYYHYYCYYRYSSYSSYYYFFYDIEVKAVCTGIVSSVPGCTDPLATNYDPLATVDDGSCIYSIPGCTDSTATNYDPLATVDDGSCIYCVYGCTDPLAFNYDPLATCDDGSCISIVYGCTDPLALNYNSGANIDNGSCIYPTCGGVTGVYVDNIIHDRATFNWDNMNDSLCQVDQYRIRYREVGTSSWSLKTMGSPTGSGCNTSNTSKLALNLTPSTTYEYDFKIWYCNASTINWHSGGTFTTLDLCPNVSNFSVSTPLTTQAVFTWNDANGPYEFARIKLRVDSISNPVSSDWQNAGGFGVMYPAFTKNKNGLVPGETYRGQARTWCNVSGGAYRSPTWTSLIYWTQPTSIRDGGLVSSIVDLEVYPNPSRDVFNLNFVSEYNQTLKVRILNVVGEEIYTEDLESFIGEYRKQINLEEYSRSIYFLEIETMNGVINKKLMLQ